MNRSTAWPSIPELHLFHVMPGNSALLLPNAPHFTIVAVTANYCETSGKSREELVGKGLFEAFPNAPGDPAQTSTKGLLESLGLVLRQKEPHELPVHRYDIPAADGVYEERYWTATNKPVFNETGEIIYLLHSVEDITHIIKARQNEEALRSVQSSHQALQKAYQALHESKEQYRLLFTSIDQGFCVIEMLFDSEGNPVDYIFLEVNPMFEQQTGLKDPEGKTARQLVPELDRHWFTIYGNVAKTGEAVRFQEGSVPMKRWFDVYAFRIGDEKSRRVALLFSDITERKLAEQALKASEEALERKIEERTQELDTINKELLKTNQHLEDFAYAASHDLKEPVRKIHFFSDRLKQQLQETLSEEQKLFFNRLENAARRMGSLIEDLLAYSQATRGLVEDEEVDLNKKVQLVLDDLEVEVQQKKARINIGPLPVIRGSKRQLQQLFQNLITNALKYSKPGTAPEVQISAKQVSGKEVYSNLPDEEGKKQFYLIQVKDNGIGFAQEDAGRIFNVFTRLHGNTEYRGTGVGLSIAQKVVQNHGGYIWAESAPGEGAIFNVLLPV